MRSFSSIQSRKEKAWNATVARWDTRFEPYLILVSDFSFHAQFADLQVGLRIADGSVRMPNTSDSASGAVYYIAWKVWCRHEQGRCGGRADGCLRFGWRWCATNWLNGPRWRYTIRVSVGNYSSDANSAISRIASTLFPFFLSERCWRRTYHTHY